MIKFVEAQSKVIENFIKILNFGWVFYEICFHYKCKNLKNYPFFS